MTVKEVIDLLKSKELDFLKTNSFSQLPGIYAFFYIGNKFPVLGDSVAKHQIIYIGKTESSQDKRDSKTHFATGKTGSSTVRKSIGSILTVNENLKPIPRNNSDYKRGRFSQFRFDQRSEEIITKWMENNLALSFYEYPKSKQEIESLETEIIDELVPILNISKNPRNKFKMSLKELRKNCAIQAAKNFSQIETKKQAIITISPKTGRTSNSEGKYIDLWTNRRELIKAKLRLATIRQSIQLTADEFNQVGNRKNYSFNLEINKGAVINNIGSSAVARDLAKVLENSTEISEILKFRHLKIKMDNGFCLWIENVG